jgi:hypothetical protein
LAIILGSNATFTSLSFSTVDGVKTAYDMYNRFKPIETWYTGIGSVKRAALVTPGGITDSELIQLESIDANTINSTAWTNLSLSGLYILNSQAFENLFNSRNYDIQEQIWTNIANSLAYSISPTHWGYIQELDQSLNTTSSPKFFVSTTDTTKLIFQGSVNVKILGYYDSPYYQNAQIFYCIIGDGRHDRRGGICCCSLISLSPIANSNSTNFRFVAIRNVVLFY